MNLTYVLGRGLPFTAIVSALLFQSLACSSLERRSGRLGKVHSVARRKKQNGQYIGEKVKEDAVDNDLNNGLCMWVEGKLEVGKGKEFRDGVSKVKKIEKYNNNKLGLRMKYVAYILGECDFKIGANRKCSKRGSTWMFPNSLPNRPIHMWDSPYNCQSQQTLSQLSQSRFVHNGAPNHCYCCYPSMIFSCRFGHRLLKMHEPFLR